MSRLNFKSFLKKKFFEKSLPWDELFDHFKEVLKSNNKALEIITDMGEKLGGEFIFDVNYVKPACLELLNTVSESIRRFDLLTQSRYPDLGGVYRRIEARIDGAVEDAGTGAGRMVLFYKDMSWDMAGEAGGKNNNLAQVRNNVGLKVPETFAMTTMAFDEFIRFNELDKIIDELINTENYTGPGLELVRDRVLNAVFPPSLSSEITSAIKQMSSLCKGCNLAVRSSAEEEDGDYSFAGQFETVLNVPLEAAAVEDAYKVVVASLFSEKAVSYRRRLGYYGEIKMAVACVAMVDAAASGVAYSINPSGAQEVLISAAWGLGTSVVDGTVDADLYTVSRAEGGHGPSISGRRIGEKASMSAPLEGGGLIQRATPQEVRNIPCLKDEQVLEIASQAALIERHFRRPQDIEWAAGKDGAVYILQARPLRVEQKGGETPLAPPEARILMEDKGIVVQSGTCAGNVFLLRHENDIAEIPKGAVVVSRTDSPGLVRAMPDIAAIITDTGAPASHMATLCREFRLPAVVNTGVATKTLRHGQMVTVMANEDGATVYDGLIKELLEGAANASEDMESLFEYRKRRQILRYIVPLNLIDPLMDDFAPEKCRTLHDVLRFIHEKSVAELIEYAKTNGTRTKGRAVKLELAIPAGIVAVDIGGGLSSVKGDSAGLGEVTSLPLKAILTGMVHPGLWRSDMVPLNARDFLSSMVRMPDIRADAGSYAGYNVAVVSKEYVNLSLRFGYHFNMLDCYMSDNARNNHIYFRFAGGATEITKRSRRIHLISIVLSDYGFNIKTKGDLIIARLSGLPKEKMEDILEQLGRLVSYTRQMDAMLHSDEAVDLYAKKFIEGNY